MSLSHRLLDFLNILEAAGKLDCLFRDEVFTTLEKFAEFHELTGEITDQVGGQADTIVLLVLRALAKQRSDLAPRLVSSDLVVTFPGTVTMPARHTAQVVREMLAAARREIIIAGYAITGDGGLPDLLAEAAQTVSRIVVVCSSWKTDAGTSAVDALLNSWPGKLPKPSVYRFNDASDAGLMHVKTLIVDSSEMLVTSANFTHYGMTRNVEFGVRITGEVAHNARAVFDAFIASGRFTRLC
jgi:phosphatidylserine/phosphatidylglycerophosphate/cardiolipin synthase-like enzyme